MSFEILEKVEKPTAFFLKRCNLRGRLDVEYNLALLRSQINSTHPCFQIREISSSKTGGTPSKSKPEYWEGTIPWASPKDFGSFYLTKTQDHISTSAVTDSSTTIVPIGTLLIVYRSGILQHSLPVTITTTDTAINQDLKALIFQKDISVEYIAAFFTIFGSRLLPLITKSGATVQSINTEQFERLEIPIPSLPIQQEVISLLDSAYLKRERSETKARKLLASIDTVLLDELGNISQPDSSNMLGERIFYTSFSEATGQRFDPHFHHPHYAKVLSAIENVNFVSLGDIVRMSHESWDQESIFEDSFPYLEIGEVDLDFGCVGDTINYAHYRSGKPRENARASRRPSDFAHSANEARHCICS
jgi:hypothetical protein